MSEIQKIIDALNDSNSAMSHLKSAMDAHPNDEILKINASAIEKRQKDIERRLDQYLNTRQNELVRYKINRDWSKSYPAKAVAASLGAFQDLFTSIFDAIKSSPKQRFRPAPENVHASTFEFAGATTGSVVVSLTVETERLLAIDSDIQVAFGLFEQLTRARTAEEISDLVEKIGVASITKAYQWADASVAHGLDTKISWGSSLGSLRDIELSDGDAKIIRDVIEDRSAEDSTTVEVRGVLHGFDGATSYFHLEELETKRDIKGNLGPGVSPAWTTGQVYIASLNRIVTLVFSTGQEKETWTLMGLRPQKELN